MNQKNSEACLLLSGVQGFVLSNEQSAADPDPGSSSALLNRDPQLFNRFDTLLVVPDRTPSPPSGRQAVLTVLPTTDCNLRCSYCYASSGSTRKELSVDSYRLILRDLVDPSRFSHLNLYLHGGGEPTLNPKLFREIVQECAGRCRTLFVQPSFTLTTNGTFGRRVRQTIEEYRINCGISWDGPDEIQQRQRPFASGENSHRVVLGNIRELLLKKLLERVRVTVTDNNIDKIPEIIRFLHQEGVPCVHIEPVSIIGRQKGEAEQGMTVERYARCIQQAYMLCCELGMKLEGTGMVAFKKPSGRHCGAFGWNFVITPWGEISACTRVQQQSDDHAESFLLGPWAAGADPLTFAAAKRKILQQRFTENLNDCAGCFLRYHCAGGCPMIISGSHDGTLRRQDDLPCELIRQCSRLVLEAVRQGYLPPGWVCRKRKP